MNPKFFWTSMFLVGVIYGIYPGMGVWMNPSAQFWAGLAIQFGVVFWLHRDMRLRDYHPAFDSRTFLFFAWPVVGPYYLFRTRGRMAFVPIVGFVALFMAGWFLGFYLGMLANG